MKELRSKNVEAPIIISTNNNTQEFKEHCIEIGANEVIEKPINNTALAECIRNMISQNV